jgi:hypothetical protein
MRSRSTILARNLVLASALGAGGAGAAFAACNDSYQPYPTAGTGGGSSSSSSSSSSSGMGGFVVAEACPSSCSNDLTKVVDCEGNVLSTCPPTQGCANGMCINDPCTAAQESKSSYGCDYYAVKTVLYDDGVCFAAFVANTWQLPVHLQVEYAGTTLLSMTGSPGSTPWATIPQPIPDGGGLTYPAYDPTVGIPVGQVAILFLSRDNDNPSEQACPMTLSAIPTETGILVNAQIGEDGNGVGNAFHITTDYPVVAYQMNGYESGSKGTPTANVVSATLLLPTSAWDTNYVAINAYENGNPSLDIVANQDGTQVTLLPRVAITGGPGNPGEGIGGVDGGQAGVPLTYTLNAGQFLQITQSEELTGSPIQATAPDGGPANVAVFGAATCMNVPAGQQTCEPAEQQIPPVKALGSEYVAVRYRSRGVDIDGGTADAGPNEPTQWRMVGVVGGQVNDAGVTDMTNLTWQPSVPTGAPTSLVLGQVAEFTSAGPFVVTSQDANHPFYLGGYMTGGGLSAPPSGFLGEGAPAWVNVIPPAQYLTHYILFTVQVFPETDLVVIRAPSVPGGPIPEGGAADGGAFADVVLNCAGGSAPITLTGWQPIGSYEYTRFDISGGAFGSTNDCTNGVQELASVLPFSVTVWGWGDALDQTAGASYAYPAGAGFQPINNVTVPPIAH